MMGFLDESALRSSGPVQSAQGAARNRQRSLGVISDPRGIGELVEQPAVRCPLRLAGVTERVDAHPKLGSERAVLAVDRNGPTCDSEFGKVHHDIEKLWIVVAVGAQQT